jgi:hypothetical protein
LLSNQAQVVNGVNDDDDNDNKHKIGIIILTQFKLMLLK